MSGESSNCPEPEHDDAALLRLYAESRSETAFATLVQRYVDLVYSTAVRCLAGDTHLARDVAQEVFVVVARRAGDLASHRVLEGWFYTTTRYEAAHAVRREQRRRVREQKAHLMNELNQDAAAEADWQQLRPLLDDAMGALNASDREAVVMRFFLHRSFREISGKLGLNEVAARRRVDRALEKLHRVLAERGVASTASAIAGLLSTQAVGAAPAGVASLATRAALAASGSGASVTLGWAGAKLALGILGVALISSLVLVSREIRGTRRAAEDALLAVERDSPSLLAARRELEQRVRAAEQDVADLARQDDPTRAVPSAGSRQPSSEGEAFLDRHPELRRAIIERSNAKLNYRWGALYRALGLDRAQIAQFQALMREGETYRAGAGADGEPLSLYLGNGLSRDQVETQFRALLGDDGMRRFREFGATIPAREQIVSLASALHMTETPLTLDQTERLVDILTRSRSAQHDPHTARFEWKAVMTAAAHVLSPPQLAAFDGVRAHDLLQAALGGARLSEALPRPHAIDSPQK